MGAPLDGDDAAGLFQCDRLQSAGRDPDPDLAATARVVTAPDQLESCGHAHPFEQGQEDVCEVVDRWRLPYVSPARHGHCNATTAGNHRWEQRLQHEHGTARRTNIELVVTPAQRTWSEAQCL